VKNSSNRKPIPVQHDRGGTLRYAWLRAPPLHRSPKTTNPILSGCLTNRAPYEGGLTRGHFVPRGAHRVLERCFRVGTPPSAALPTLHFHRFAGARRETAVSFDVMNSSSAGVPFFVCSMPRLIAGTIAPGSVTRSP
jgi:hypothetical protein